MYFVNFKNCLSYSTQQLRINRTELTEGTNLTQKPFYDACVKNFICRVQMYLLVFEEQLILLLLSFYSSICSCWRTRPPIYPAAVGPLLSDGDMEITLTPSPWPRASTRSWTTNFTIPWSTMPHRLIQATERGDYAHPDHISPEADGVWMADIKLGMCFCCVLGRVFFFFF